MYTINLDNIQVLQAKHGDALILYCNNRPFKIITTV